jgi:hypothetical protein
MRRGFHFSSKNEQEINERKKDDEKRGKGE